MKKILLHSLLLTGLTHTLHSQVPQKDAMDIDSFESFFNEKQKPESSTDESLHKAAYNGDIDTLYSLLEKNNNGGNVFDLQGKTPLHIAVENRQCACVKLLCSPKYTTDINKKDLISGWAPLHIATYLQNPDCISILCQHGANPNIQEYMTYRTPLHIAALQKNQVCIDILCKAKGIIVNAADSDGLTPLHVASGAGNINIMKQILFYSGPHFLSFIVQRDRNGKTAYDHACDHGHHDAARMLKELEKISMSALKRITTLEEKSPTTCHLGKAMNVHRLQPQEK